MTNLEFFKMQSKNLLKDFNTRVFDEDEGFYEYSPRFFHDIETILYGLNVDEEGPFTLMKAQHVVAKLSGFYKWNDLIKASGPMLEIGKLLLINREVYARKQGFSTNMTASLILDDWKSYENKYLQDCTDEEKLNAFIKVFIEQNDEKVRNNAKVILNFSNDENAQDMLNKIIKKRNLTPEKAVLSSITQANCVTILATGWSGIAVDHWGHASIDNSKEKLKDPILEVKLGKEKERLVKIVMEKERVTLKTAVLYFMIFALSKMGYHI